jgi:hypothetical protein
MNNTERIDGMDAGIYRVCHGESWHKTESESALFLETGLTVTVQSDQLALLVNLWKPIPEHQLPLVAVSSLF